MTKWLKLFILLALIASIVLVARYNIDSINNNIVSMLGVKIATPDQLNYPANNTLDCTFSKESLESDMPLPEKVKDSFKSTIALTVKFRLNSPGIYSHTRIFNNYGTAFITKDVILSARHNFLREIKELSSDGVPFTLDENNLPRSIYYNYSFYGSTNINGSCVSFPLELIGMGDPYKPQDFAAFKAINLPPQLKGLEFEENVKLEVLDDRLDEDEIYYSSGRIPSFGPHANDLNPINKSILIDFINYNFAGTISSIMPDNKDTGIEKMFRINGLKNNAEPGFSGGPVFDRNGKVIGMTVFLSPGYNFSDAISAKDLESFIQRLKDEGKIPKK